MSRRFNIRRYNAFYHGWCLAFGEHKVEYEASRDINWLLADDRVGLCLSNRFRKKLSRELLGPHEQTPELILNDEVVRINSLIYRFTDEIDSSGVHALRQLLLVGDELHMFLSSHFVYPPKTRIITFARKKPLPIMYKEMLPMMLRLE